MTVNESMLRLKAASLKSQRHRINKLYNDFRPLKHTLNHQFGFWSKENEIIQALKDLKQLAKEHKKIVLGTMSVRLSKSDMRNVSLRSFYDTFQKEGMTLIKSLDNFIRIVNEAISEGGGQMDNEAKRIITVGHTLRYWYTSPQNSIQ